jgi:hypothetical protein
MLSERNCLPVINLLSWDRSPRASAVIRHRERRKIGQYHPGAGSVIITPDEKAYNRETDYE